MERGDVEWRVSCYFLVSVPRVVSLNTYIYLDHSLISGVWVCLIYNPDERDRKGACPLNTRPL